MNKRLITSSVKTLLHTIALMAVVFALSLQGFAQTAANTDIKNVATATYSDGTNSYSAVSNEVTVTVAKVGGLAITPDGQTDPAVVAGQTGITKTFTVTNTGNFSETVNFLASGGSVTVSGPATITSATVNGVDILTNAAAVQQVLAQGASATVVVTYSVNSSAAAGSTIQVFLGDATTGTNFDNVAADGSTNEVATLDGGAVNGAREARGDISATVQNDALPKVTLTAPAGPVTLGSTITYTAQACNDGLKALNPVAPDTQVYVYAPIPAGTVLTNVASLPVGTQFTTSPLSTAPLSATWSNTAPATLSTVTRIRIPVGASIAAGACAPAVSFDVDITTTNANTPIYEIVDVFGSNSIGATVTDQSGDNTPNKGDGNANFDEPLAGGTATPNQGFQQPTLLAKVGNVLLGPSGAPGAAGPTDNNDDFTNKSVTTGINVAPGGVTTAAGTVTFTNTVQNTGNANDVFTLTAPTVPTGFTVRISTDNGANWTTVSGGGSTTLAVAFGASANFLVEVTEPAGNTVLTGYDTVIRATSGLDNTKSNDTIDRLYTGFIKLDKTAVVNNATGVGAATDAVPGAEITYTITYTNVSSTATGQNVGLTASNLVITEDGSVAPNNWGSTTNQVVGSASDSNSGTITGDAAGSSVLTDTVATLAPGASGTFTFKRVIK